MSIKIKNRDSKIELYKEIEEIKSKKNSLLLSNSSLKDLSHLKTYTIDDDDIFEIDDAISLEKTSSKYKLWIHIASPALHIDYNSTIDKIARKLTSTIYLSTNNIYMFPESLINDLFSLTNNEKRGSLSLGVIFNNDGSISYSEIVQSLIKPNYKLNYEDAEELIYYAPKEEEDLSIISMILEKRKSFRKKFGAMEITETYAKIIVNDNLPSIKLIEPSQSRQLISEAMILYGDLISKYTKNNKIPVPYRVQDTKNRLNNDYNFSSEKRIYNNFLLKKSFGKTYYSVEPLRHNSLGLNSYLHATSPIRRYSDLLVHYQINRFLNNKNLISKDEIDKNIIEINKQGRENINRYREDQKIWLNKLFENNKNEEYRVIFLNWINRYKNICILYLLFTKYI